MTCRNSACASTRLASVICPRHLATHSLRWHIREVRESKVWVAGYFSCGGQAAEDIPGGMMGETKKDREHSRRVLARTASPELRILTHWVGRGTVVVSPGEPFSSEWGEPERIENAFSF